MSKPVIGLNTDYRLGKDGTTAFHCISARYSQALTEVGAIPVVLPLIEDDDDLSRILDMLDGMILVGGGDLDPRNDGFMLHPSVRPMDRARERFDRRLASMVHERCMPVYGIGVGMQLLNVTAGGNLFLHIAEDLPKALPHCDCSDRAHRHALEIEMGTLMERVYGEGEIRVNSMHHMAVDELAPGFMITARCPDGVVEAFESIRDDWFVLGTQFHPEAASASKLDMRIFEEFVMAVAQRVEQPVELQLVA
ncbi:MAG: gamma-glutamyl-gamma-aminobutyrate hydrolase family protein [Planctomycetia bacterium]|jgi:putative glutamine amidotransferase